MRIIFMGTPEFSVPVLNEIIGQGHDVAAVYTRAPKPAGRGMEVKLSPVHRAANSFGIGVLYPKSLRGEAEIAEFASLEADVAVVVAYGLLLPQAILDAPKKGCLNLHASLLPRWRGAAPIQRAIMAGDTQTGVMVMRMDEGLDTGAIAMAERVAIPPEMNAGQLQGALCQIGADLMARALAALARDSLQFQPQSAQGAIYARKIESQDRWIDFDRPVQEVHNHIRGLAPFPGAFFIADFGKGKERIKVLAAQISQGDGVPGTLLDDTGIVACATGAVRLAQVQRAGKAPMSAADFLRGLRLPNGTLLAAS